MARSRRTPAMLVRRCSSKLSGHRLQAQLKRYRPRDGKGDGGAFSGVWLGDDGTAGSLGGCDFFDCACSWWPESLEEHLRTSIAGVLRLRAIGCPLCDRFARRFAQDDAFVGG